MLRRKRRFTLGNSSFNKPRLDARAPERHPLSVPGDFYVEKDVCIACGLPEMVAPDLIAHIEEPYYHCYWKKQPETPSEMQQAFNIFEGQEAGCHRYLGTDPKIQERIGSENCDHPLPR